MSDNPDLKKYWQEVVKNDHMKGYCADRAFIQQCIRNQNIKDTSLCN